MLTGLVFSLCADTSSRTLFGLGGVMVLDDASYMNLYLELPYATFCADYVNEPERLAAYWRLAHTTKPEYLYIPYYHHNYWFRLDERIIQEKLDSMRPYLDFDCTYGEAGIIVHVRSLLWESYGAEQ